MNDDVTFADGTRGTLIAMPVPDDPDGMAEVLMDGGQTLFVPINVLIVEENSYRIAAHPSGFQGTLTRGDEIVIPLVAETLSVGKREVETGRVRFSTTVTERVETVDEPLFRTEVEVKRVAVGQFVDAPPAVRYEQDVMIVPIMEEVLVIEKRLRVKEEVYISQKREEYRSPRRVTLRSETLSEERLTATDPQDIP